MERQALGKITIITTTTSLVFDSINVYAEFSGCAAVGVRYVVNACRQKIKTLQRAICNTRFIHVHVSGAVVFFRYLSVFSTPMLVALVQQLTHAPRTFLHVFVLFWSHFPSKFDEYQMCRSAYAKDTLSKVLLDLISRQKKLENKFSFETLQFQPQTKMKLN